MKTCPVCSNPVPENTLSCPHCDNTISNTSSTAKVKSGADEAEFAEIEIHSDTADIEFAETRVQPAAPDTASQTPTTPHPVLTPDARSRQPGSGQLSADRQSLVRYSSGDSSGDARFPVGSIIADRYRILGQLGKGGMGEVYRADDLKLGQPVALKFLPEELSNDGAMLARFHREVRIARQVSHPNVCRVFDIGEVADHFGSQHFLSMEYIDGEDLSTLMRRIGRFPQDKAIEIARQICAGLAAAHDNGVLHRDLKPANIMLDGRGKAHITDFGLAGLAGEIGADDVRSGTPAYMAPEQFAGKEVSVKSDIYSLGLVLYEIFTGKRVFEAASLADLMMLHEKSTPANMTSHVKEIDPLVEKVILRCLEKDPKKRPATALQVAAALPGGDPLAAALAAGETPSPEMVAAARKEGALRPAVAVSLLAVALLLIVVILFLAPKTMLHNIVPLEKSADVLADRGNTIAKKLGYTYTPGDSAYGFGVDHGYLSYLQSRDRSPLRWQQLAGGQPASLHFWYRQSRYEFVPLNGRYVQSFDPPSNISDMVFLGLDTRGNLMHFLAVPPQYDESTGAAPMPDWAMLFAEAGLNIADYRPASPKWVASVNSDTRVAWDGVFPEAPDIPLHIEAASYRGKPVYFSMLSEWNRPMRMEEAPQSAISRFFVIVSTVILAAIVFGGLMLARRNLKLGRGDRKGALRLAIFVFCIQMIGWALFANHIASLSEMGLVITSTAYALLFACLVWVLYIALEPYVRRKNPERIISWSRLLAGDFRDPLVGRDLLIGGLVGLGIAFLNHLSHIAPAWFAIAPDAPNVPILNTLLGMRGVLSMYAMLHQDAIFAPMGTLFLFVLLSMLVKNERVALFILWLAMFMLSSSDVSGHILIDLIFNGASVALLVFALMRFGLLAMMAAQFFFVLFFAFPITLDFAAWYSTGCLFAIFIALALMTYGFYTSLAGQKLFRANLLDD